MPGNHQASGAGYSFGAFKGVFTPSILTILGVIMYLRLGWVLGQVGLPLTLLIVTLATAITFLTGLSLSATATNMPVGGGGAYFMISRSLGIEAGAAIGVPLFLAQAVGVAFYITGFAETLAGSLDLDPWISRLPFALTETRFIAIVTLLALTAITAISADLALKTQVFILGAILLSLISFFLGGTPADAPARANVDISAPLPFWAVFAVFFPAVTGIEAGLAMSGDLKNPARALPRGTLGAVLTGYAIYMTIPLILARHVPDRARLLNDPMIIQSVARWGILILPGIWAATLSSALGAMLGAPRTLQALSRDRVLPRFLGRGYGSRNDPRPATLVTLLVALAAIMVGDLNRLAAILSMFFLTSYGLLNLSAGLEGIIDSPSWRPAFRVRPGLAFAGAAGCLMAMLMIDAGATFAAIAIVGAIYGLEKHRNLKARWGDMRYGILSLIAGFAIRRLALRKPDERSWRPNILVLSGAPQRRWRLIEMAGALARGNANLTVAAVVAGERWTLDRIRSLRAGITDYLNKRGVDALVKIIHGNDFFDGADALIKAYGFGPIKPNTILMGDSEDPNNSESFASLMLATCRMERNLILVSEQETESPPVIPSSPFIDIWWRGRQTNIGLILALAHLLKRDAIWSKAVIRLKRIIENAEEQAEVTAAINTYLSQQRLDATLELAPRNGMDIFDLIRESSRDASLVFLGLRKPAPEETSGAYAAYYRLLREKTAGMPAAFVYAADQVDFTKIIGIS